MTSAPARIRVEVLRAHLAPSARPGYDDVDNDDDEGRRRRRPLTADALSASSTKEDGKKQHQQQQDKKEQQLPGPWISEADPVYGNGVQLHERTIEGTADQLFLEWTRKYGPVYKWNELVVEAERQTMKERVVVADGKLAKQMLKKMTRKPREYEDLLLLRKGVLSINDPAEWQRQRNLLKACFSAESLRGLMPIMNNAAGRICEYLEPHVGSGEVVNIYDHLCMEAFLVIGHSALGEESDYLTSIADRLRSALSEVLFKGFTGAQLDTDEGYSEAFDVMNNFASEVFRRYEERKRMPSSSAKAAEMGCPHHQALQAQITASPAPKKEEAGQTLLDVILGCDENNKPHFDEVQRVSQLTTFVFAGHETTANTMAFTILELSRNPDVQERLFNEIHALKKQILQKNHVPITPAALTDFRFDYKDLFQLTYLTKCIFESMRRWTVVTGGSTREVETPITLGGEVIPPGTLIGFHNNLPHMDPKYWENPEVYDPERNLVNSDAFSPFTRPPRDCLGRNLAMMEMRTVLGTLFGLYKITSPDPTRRIDTYNVATSQPAEGVPVLVEKRNLLQ